MRSFKLTVAYDGGDFSGWQSQPGKRTVQGELERALTQALGGESIQAIACSRTDAGVHALGQIVSLDTATRLSAERLAMESHLQTAVAQGSAAEGDAAAAFQDLHDSLSNQRTQMSGVSLDEETILLLQFQRAYQSAARLISTIDELYQALLNM